MGIRGSIVCLALLMAVGACHHTRQNPKARDRTDGSSAQGREMTGTIRYVDLEGGFYGLETDEGVRLDPVNLTDEFKKDGLRVRARVEELPDRVSFHMWGRLVRIVEIERL